MEIESKDDNQKTEEEKGEDTEDDKEDSSGKEDGQEVEEDVEMVAAQPGLKEKAPQKRNGMVDFGADDTDNEDEEEKGDEEEDTLVQAPDPDTNKKQREEQEKKLYAAWNKVSERALVKVEGKWFDIYDTDLLSPLPSPTKKFMKDFNQTNNEKIKPVKPGKTSKKAGPLGLALNLYGSPGGKGYVNMKENQEGANSTNTSRVLHGIN